MQACIASALHLRLDDVPDFVALHGVRWLAAFQEWLARFNMGVVYVAANGYLGIPETMPRIVCGPSSRGLSHATVEHAGKVFDPFPDGEGLVTRERVFFFVMLDPSRLALPHGPIDDNDEGMPEPIV